MNTTKELDFKKLADYLKPRCTDCHKGDFGRVLIIGGDIGYSGAVRLAGEAAMRVGAGAVMIATHPEHATSLNVSCPELMCHGVNEANHLSTLLEQATFTVIGPGLGQSAWSVSLLKISLALAHQPLLLDADALNLLATNQIELQRDNCIFTPHPGEAARLLKTTPFDVQADRISAIRNLQALLNGIIVLKGANTLVLANQDEIGICKAGNPGMATAGMGDVLSGVIGGLAAQHIPLTDATKLGVLIHAMAGDLSASQQGERGMMASDLMCHLRTIVNR